MMFYWQYLNPASLKDPAINDVEDFKHLEQSMDQVGLNMEEKYNLFQIVAAVLHLGNITFEENTADRKGSYCTRTQTDTHTHTHTHTNMYTHKHVHRHVHTLTRTHTNTYTHMHANTQTYTHARTHTSTHTNTHRHKHTHTYVHTYIHTHTNTCAHTNTQTTSFKIVQHSAICVSATYIHSSFCELRLFVCTYVGGSLVSGKSKASVATTSQLLGLNEEELKRSLTSRVMITTKGGTVGTIIKLVIYM